MLHPVYDTCLASPTCVNSRETHIRLSHPEVATMNLCWLFVSPVSLRLPFGPMLLRVSFPIYCCPCLLVCSLVDSVCAQYRGVTRDVSPVFNLSEDTCLPWDLPSTNEKVLVILLCCNTDFRPYPLLTHRREAEGCRKARSYVLLQGQWHVCIVYSSMRIKLFAFSAECIQMLRPCMHPPG